MAARWTYRRIRRIPRAIGRRMQRVVEPPTGKRALRRRLVAEGAAPHPQPPGRAWTAWVNRALREESELEEALAELKTCGLAPHEDRPKNWDLLIALGLILESTGRDAAVLDMGATQYSRLLPWLFLYGYRSLRGIDLVYTEPIKAGPIRYERMDLTATTFPDRSFDAITSLSVIEHGVDPDRYLREAGRLLRPGGLLITSTDYWCGPVDTGGQTAYGVPIKIFQPDEIRDLVHRAAAHGLEPTGPLDLTCGERAVTWARFGLHYTFVNVVLRRAA